MSFLPKFYSATGRATGRERKGQLTNKTRAALTQQHGTLPRKSRCRTLRGRPPTLPPQYPQTRTRKCPYPGLKPSRLNRKKCPCNRPRWGPQSSFRFQHLTIHTNTNITSMPTNNNLSPRSAPNLPPTHQPRLTTFLSPQRRAPPPRTTRSRCPATSATLTRGRLSRRAMRATSRSPRRSLTKPRRASTAMVRPLLKRRVAATQRRKQARRASTPRFPRLRKSGQGNKAPTGKTEGPRSLRGPDLADRRRRLGITSRRRRGGRRRRAAEETRVAGPGRAWRGRMATPPLLAGVAPAGIITG